MLILFSTYYILWLKKPSINRNLVLAITLIILFFFVGFLRGNIYKNSIQNNILTEQKKAEAKSFLLDLSSAPVEKDNSYKMEVIIKGVFIENTLLAHNEPALLYIPKSAYKDSLVFVKYITAFNPPSLISSPKNPKEFDYKKYLKGLGISHQFYLKEGDFKLLSQNRKTDFFSFFENLRNWNLNKLKELGLKGDSFSIISALVFGQKDTMDKELYSAYGAAGATHVLAVSGLHVGLIYVILTFLTKKLARKTINNWIRVIFIILCLWFYAALTGFSPSVLRAATMFSFITAASLNKNSSNIYNTIAISALFLLFIYPSLIMEVGFQLSYSAVLGILLIQPHIYRVFTFNSYFVDKAWQITTVSIAAQIGTFPLAMLYFHQFPNYFILSNLFVIPVATVILYLSLVVLAFSYFSEVAALLAKTLDYIVSALNFVIRKMETLPYSKTVGIDITVLECFILYAIIITTSSFLIIRKFEYLKICLILLVVLSFLQCKEKFEHLNQQIVTVHNIHNFRAISLIDGEKVFCLHSDKFNEEKEKITFHLSHYWDEKGVSKVHFLDINEDTLKGNFFQLKNKVLLLKNKAIYLTDEVPIDLTTKKEQLVLLDSFKKDSLLNTNLIYLADGFTKKKYLFHKNKSKKVNVLDYALDIQ